MAVLTVDSKQAAELAGTTISEEALDLAFPDGEERELKRPLPGFDTIRSALQDFAEGKFVVVLDNEDRENEGDLIMAADKVCPSLTTHEQTNLVWYFRVGKATTARTHCLTFYQAQHGHCSQLREGLKWIAVELVLRDSGQLSTTYINKPLLCGCIETGSQLAAKRTHRETQVLFQN